jgi:hypothetical protein
VSKSPKKSAAIKRPLASQAKRARIRPGWRLVVDAIDSGRV